MIQSYFYNIEELISSYISSAGKNIKVAVAWFTNQVLFDCLVEACKRNVEVKILVLDDILNRCEFGLNFGALIEYGGDVRFVTCSDSDGTMHNKFCIIDDKVITGSYNWTYHANKNNENVLVTDDVNIINNYCQQFDKLFNNGTSVEMPYKHLIWADVKEGDFSELRRNICRDVNAKNEDKNLRRNKLISLNNAYKSGNKEEILAASTLPITEIRTITEVLTSRWHDYEFELWHWYEWCCVCKEECCTCTDNVSAYKLGKWIFIPTNYGLDGHHREYIVGVLKKYGVRNEMLTYIEEIKIYDSNFISSIKRFVKIEELLRNNNSYKKIPEDILCIQYARLFVYKFPHKMYKKDDVSRICKNGEPRLIPAIHLFCIVKDKEKSIFYEGWDPKIKGEKILKQFFSDS